MRTRETFRRYAIEDPSEIAVAFEKLGAYVTPRIKRRGINDRFFYPLAINEKPSQANRNDPPGCPTSRCCRKKASS
jgi:hypothetical protein